MSDTDSQAIWEARYGAAPQWSGKVNDAVRAWGEAHRPTPGDTALDLACGEGADALWLAGEGWRVTGVDFAESALARAAAEAAARGLDVTWVAANLATWEPDAPYRLVTLSFFHESRDVRVAVWRTASAAVAPGGTLLITAHAPDPDPEAPGPPLHRRFDVDELVEAIGPGWSLEYAEVRRDGIGRHAGHTMTDLIAEFTRPSAQLG